MKAPWRVLCLGTLLTLRALRPLGELNPYLMELQARHLQRAEEDPHFTYYRALMAKAERNQGPNLFVVERRPCAAPNENKKTTGA